MGRVRTPDRADERATDAASPSTREQTRARYPETAGYVERDGVTVAWEAYGDRGLPIVFVPTWSIVTSRIWKLQIPYFARRHRVLTFDARGNGRSARPTSVEAYDEEEMALDLLAVMDAAAIDRAILVSLSLGAHRSLIATHRAPDRVAGLVFIGPSLPMGRPVPGRDIDFAADLGVDEGWARYNQHSWRRDYAGFLTFFFENCFTESHSTKPIEDALGWGLETDAETLILTDQARGIDHATALAITAGIDRPTLVIQGDEDAITGPSRGLALSRAIPGAELVLLAGGGHIPNARHPVRVNLLIERFARSVASATT
jgi:pimeloyl-ACP methyl ester carboxylesterase